MSKQSDKPSLARWIVGGVCGAVFAYFVGPIAVDWFKDWREDRKPAVTLTVSRPPTVTEPTTSVDSAAVVWAGQELPPSNAIPPTTCDNWPAWAPTVEAVDVGTTTLVLTIQSPRKAAISIEGIEFDVTERRDPPVAAAYAYCEVTGGASSSPRQMEVSLDNNPPSPQWFDAGEEIQALALTLDEGETERIWLRVWTLSCDCSWRADLNIVVDGESDKLPITDDDGKPFRTVAGPVGLPLWRYQNDEWILTKPDPRLTPCAFANSTGALSAASACRAAAT